jgi:7-keto-8-aminopelargonate synthetase-like enzyme
VVLTNSCTAANCATIPTLVGKGDVVASDRLNHASIIDGCRLSRADTVVYDNTDLADLRRQLAAAPAAPRRAVMTDGVFSMEGATADLPALLRVADDVGATLVVDDSHGLGVRGPTGRGSLEEFGVEPNRCMQTGTLAKALGAGIGGYAAGPHEVIDTIRSCGRFAIFASTVPAVLAAAALAAAETIAGDPEPLARLRHNTAYLRSGLRSIGVRAAGDEASPIVPVFIGDEGRARQAASALFADGLQVPSFASPVVPPGTARLRIQVSAAHTHSDLDVLIETIDRLTATLIYEDKCPARVMGQR